MLITGSLIRTYGNEFPFRFGKNSHVYNRSQMLEIRYKYTEKMSLDDWHWELKKKLDRNEKQHPRPEKATFLYVSYPLYNLKYESGKQDDLITGMEKIKHKQIVISILTLFQVKKLSMKWKN